MRTFSDGSAFRETKIYKIKENVFFCFPMFSFVFIIGRLAAKINNTKPYR